MEEINVEKLFYTFVRQSILVCCFFAKRESTSSLALEKNLNLFAIEAAAHSRQGNFAELINWITVKIILPQRSTLVNITLHRSI